MAFAFVQHRKVIVAYGAKNKSFAEGRTVMPNDNKYPASLDTYVTQLQATADGVRKQTELLHASHESINRLVNRFVETSKTLEKALEPILLDQKLSLQVIDSVRLPQVAVPDFSPIARQAADFQKAVQEFVTPAFSAFCKSFDELPARTQEALLLLGRHGWYLDPEIQAQALWELKGALADGNVAEAEDALVEYFESRVSEIEEFISTKFPHRAHLIQLAFKAHRRTEYALSIPVFLAQVDGICKETVDQYLFIRKDRKPRTAVYVAQLAADTYMAALLSPLAATLPIGATEKERPEGLAALNRHMVLHGESLDYGSKVNSLKTISLLNYVAYVLPTGNLN